MSAAGLNIRQPWVQITPECWDDQLCINLKTSFFLARELVPAMKGKGKGKGRIINIASLQSKRAFPKHPLQSLQGRCREADKSHG